MADGFEFSGLDGVLQRLQQFGDAAIEAADEAVAEAAVEGAGHVRSAAPVDTGRLRASVTHTHHGWGLATIEAGEGVPYMRAQEARLKFFNRSISEVQTGLLERVSSAIQAKAFR